MANRQNIDLMGGFRRAMPFTCATLLIGCLALAAFPATSGFFSKDEILAFAEHRGGFYWAFAIGGYVGALLTAFYAFRIGFRAAFGDPVPEARELERGHIHHAEPENPATGEREDTDVVFPGPSHQIAEREWPMKIAMSILAFGALFAGLIQVPGVDAVVEHFLEGSFEDSTLYNDIPSAGAQWLGLGVGGLISLLGIGIAAQLYLRRPGTTKRLQERFAALHRFLFNKWYFDELNDLLFVRTAKALGLGLWRGGDQGIIDRFGPDGVAAAALETARRTMRLQTGYVYHYAFVMLIGVAAFVTWYLLLMRG